MKFTEPVTFEEAIRIAQARGLFPTNLSSAELQALGDELDRLTVFSARTNSAEYLQAVKDLTASLLQGEFNEATVRAKLQDALDSLSYDPATGFRGIEDPNIPPAEPGSLRDLGSDARTQLVLRTQMRQMANRGYRAEGLSEGALFQFPAWELIRIYPRQVPRGDWPQRFTKSGGTLRKGRMAALKTDGVWARLGDPDMFSDAIGTDYPPFAFGSGMGWKQISRAVCEQLGLGTEQPGKAPPAPRLDDVKRKLPDGLDEAFLKDLRDKLDLEISEGYARLKAGKP